jgi:hypothetical protein
MAIDVGIVDRLPGEPVRAGGLDRGFGLNVILSGRLEPEGVTGCDDTWACREPAGTWSNATRSSSPAARSTPRSA